MGEDPTMNRLDAMAADLIGKERALFVPSGTMGNVVALMTHCRRGEEVAVGEKAHVLNIEKAIFMEEFFGLLPVTIPDPAGKLDLALLEQALQTRPIRLVCVENTHNFAGGAAVPPEHLQHVQALAHAHQVPVHMDGARLFNAAAALKIEAKVLAATVDSVMFCLSKGLSAPIGSMIAGTGPFMKRAWERRKLLGGQMRQVGVVAAAGGEHPHPCSDGDPPGHAQRCLRCGMPLGRTDHRPVLERKAQGNRLIERGGTGLKKLYFVWARTN